MLDSDKRMIIKKFSKLVKCNVNDLADIMLQKGIFSPAEIQEIFNVRIIPISLTPLLNQLFTEQR